MLVREAIPLIVAAAAELLANSGNVRAAAAASRLHQKWQLGSIKRPEALQPLSCLPSASEHCQNASLGKLLSTCGQDLPWTAGDHELPASISGKNMFVEIVGPNGPLVSEEIRTGLYFQSPHAFYPPHSHSAEEFYYLLSGSVEWQKDDEAFSLFTAPNLIHHWPWQRHAMRTEAKPLLALWAWIGDISDSTYSIDAF